MAAAVHKLFGNVVVCDDIRHELNNKKTLVGVFSGDIIVYSKPAVFAFAVYIEYYPKIKKPHGLNLFVTVGTEKLEAATTVAEHEGDSVIIALPRVAIGISDDGLISIAASVNGGPQGVILEKRISLRPPSTETNALPPPS